MIEVERPTHSSGPDVAGSTGRTGAPQPGPAFPLARRHRRVGLSAGDGTQVPRTGWREPVPSFAQVRHRLMQPPTRIGSPAENRGTAQGMWTRPWRGGNLRTCSKKLGHAGFSCVDPVARRVESPSRRPRRATLTPDCGLSTRSIREQRRDRIAGAVAPSAEARGQDGHGA